MIGFNSTSSAVIAGLPMAGVVFFFLTLLIYPSLCRNYRRQQNGNHSRDTSTDHLPGLRMCDSAHILRQSCGSSSSNHNNSSVSFRYGTFTQRKPHKFGRSYAPTPYPVWHRQRRAVSSHSMHHDKSNARADKKSPIPEGPFIHAPIPQRPIPIHVLGNLCH